MESAGFSKYRSWPVFCLFNLLLVSLLGILLRYKIAFSLPALDYKFLLNAHSHFAFSGWASTVIFTAFVYLLSRSGVTIRKIYSYQFLWAQSASYGMLLSFPFQGYGPVSIFFSVLSILFSYWFAVTYWKDITGSEIPVWIQRWVKAALLFFVLSSAGPFLLAYIMSRQVAAPRLYYNSVYLFLHFQYNGWFSFGVMALFFFSVWLYKVPLDKRNSRLFFILMTTACIPAYCLSLLWMDPPVWVSVIAAAAACLQLAALIILVRLVWQSRDQWRLLLSMQVKIFWGFSFIAFMIKLVLQALSVIPALGRLAFGFRAVIIGYLHLVVLGFISFFMIGFLLQEKMLHCISGFRRMSAGIFIAGVLINEILLVLQGLSAINYLSGALFPFLLFIAAIIMFAGLALLLIPEIFARRTVVISDSVSGGK